MKDNQVSLKPVTIVISELVQQGKVAEYELWVTGVNQAVAQFPGFMGVEVIKPRNPQYLEYVVIVRFDTTEHLQVWQQSEICINWLKKTQSVVVRQSESRQASGLELWFALPDNIQRQVAPPPYYKQVIMGILAVYPLVLLVNFIFAPIIAAAPYLLGVFFSVIAISMLMAYPVMPNLTRLLTPWLYPSVKEKR